MMRGTTIRRQATLPVTFRLPSQPNLTLEFVIDTGFTEDLTLPLAAVAALNLPYRYQQRANLADGTVKMDIHRCLERRCLTIKNCASGFGRTTW